MTNKLKVKICGQEYTLVSGDSPAYMKKTAELIDGKIKEVLERSPVLSTSMASLLVALNLADELEKIKLAAREKVDAQAAEIAALKKQLEELQNKPFPPKGHKK